MDRIVQSVQEKAPDLQQKQQNYQTFRSEHHKSDALGEALAVVTDLENKVHKLGEPGLETNTSSFSPENSTLAIDTRTQESQYRTEIGRMNAESFNRTRAFESEKEEMRNDFAAERERLIAESSETREYLESEIERIEKNYETEVNRHIAELLRMKRDFEFEKTMMIHDFDSEKAELKDRYTKEVGEANAALITERESHAAQQRQIERQLNAKNQQIESSLNQKLADMESEFKAKASRLKQEFAVQDGRLRGDIESLNGALLARDRFIPIADHELESRFLDLAEEIDQLARFEWHFEQSDWTGHLLNRFSKNPKRLKKELLQDSLWMILYESIFCSPFRIFGEEGRNLEAQWNDAFGKGWCHLSPLLERFLKLNRLPKGERILQLANTRTGRRTMEVRDHQAVSRSPGATSI